MSDVSPVVYNDLSSLGRLKAQSGEKPQETLQEAARQFEALFMQMMLKAMRDTLPDDSMFGSSSMKTYQEMFDQQLALDLSRKSGLGLSDLIARQLSPAIADAGERSEAEGGAPEVQDGNARETVNGAQASAAAAYRAGAEDRNGKPDSKPLQAEG